MDGAELKSIRKALGYTQAEFASLIGLSRDYVGILERENGEVGARTALAVKAIRPKGAGARSPLSNDTLERMVEQALIDAGIAYRADRAGESPSRLDFHLPALGVDIEVKRFHSERTAEQIARTPNVILLVGERAVEMFCLALGGQAGLLSIAMTPLGKSVKTARRP